MEITIGTIALVPVIVAIIELFKKLGMSSTYAPWANGILSIAGYALMVFVQANPTYEQPVTLGLNALLVFLSAGGFYEVVSRTVSMK